MRYWVFNEAQLDKALAEWLEAFVHEGGGAQVMGELHCATIKDFLLSPVASAEKILVELPAEE